MGLRTSRDMAAEWQARYYESRDEVLRLRGELAELGRQAVATASDLRAEIRGLETRLRYAERRAGKAAA